MATIIEVQETKLEDLTECVERMLTYGSKVMDCIEEMQHSKEDTRRSRYNRYL